MKEAESEEVLDTATSFFRECFDFAMIAINWGVCDHCRCDRKRLQLHSWLRDTPLSLNIEYSLGDDDGITETPLSLPCHPKNWSLILQRNPFLRTMLSTKQRHAFSTMRCRRLGWAVISGELSTRSVHN